ncbi:MAG: OmpH family outer membrane protein [Verrucomicrobiae bacterium]|nr:OmpH family outer membrane protein [Verrucomicrobiae bacterium]NNJ43699.1 hypothetical protein [Akkermansiaceae bacterium]
MNLLRYFPATLAIFCWVLTAQTSLADIKAATVDVGQLLTGYHVAHNKIRELNADQKNHAKEHEERQQYLREVSGKITATLTKIRNKATPTTEQNQLYEEFDDLVSQYKVLHKDIETSKRDQAQKAAKTKKAIAQSTRQHLNEIQKVIHQYAKDNGYHWMIETSGASNSQISPLIYARDATDVTKPILSILNKEAPEDEVKSSEPQNQTTKPEQSNP